MTPRSTPASRHGRRGIHVGRGRPRLRFAAVVATLSAGGVLLTPATTSAQVALPPLPSSSGNAAYDWGFGTFGELGDGLPVNSSSPAQVAGSTPVTTQLGDVAQMATGGYFTLALDTHGVVWGWGINNYGQLGQGSTDQQVHTTPVQVAGLPSNIVAVTAGAYHALALTSTGAVWAWGRNAEGELGDGTTTDQSTPEQITGLSGVTAISAGAAHNLALTSSGTVDAWGYNAFGELGLGNQTDAHTPTAVTSLPASPTAVAAGSYHSLALIGGSVYAWGLGDTGQLGDGQSSNCSNTLVPAHISMSPVQVPGLSGITAVAGGSGHSMALTSAGTVYAWGDNLYGEIGDGRGGGGSDAVVAIAPVSSAVLGSGSGFCPATPEIDASPAQVFGLSGVTQISAGWLTSYAVNASGVMSWGNNTFGQLGDGTTVDRNVPTAVSGLFGAVRVDAGIGPHVAALAEPGLAPPVPVKSATSVGGVVTVCGNAGQGTCAGLTSTEGTSASVPQGTVVVSGQMMGFDIWQIAYVEVGYSNPCSAPFDITSPLPPGVHVLTYEQGPTFTSVPLSLPGTQAIGSPGTVCVIRDTNTVPTTSLNQSDLVQISTTGSSGVDAMVGTLQVCGSSPAGSAAGYDVCTTRTEQRPASGVTAVSAQNASVEVFGSGLNSAAYQVQYVAAGSGTACLAPMNPASPPSGGSVLATVHGPSFQATYTIPDAPGNVASFGHFCTVEVPAGADGFSPAGNAVDVVVMPSQLGAAGLSSEVPPCSPNTSPVFGSPCQPYAQPSTPPLQSGPSLTGTCHPTSALRSAGSDGESETLPATSTLAGVRATVTGYVPFDDPASNPPTSAYVMLQSPSTPGEYVQVGWFQHNAGSVLFHTMFWESNDGATLLNAESDYNIPVVDEQYEVATPYYSNLWAGTAQTTAVGVREYTLYRAGAMVADVVQANSAPTLNQATVAGTVNTAKSQMPGDTSKHEAFSNLNLYYQPAGVSTVPGWQSWGDGGLATPPAGAPAGTTITVQNGNTAVWGNAGSSNDFEVWDAQC